MSWAPELPGGRPGHNWAWGPGGGRRVTRTLLGRRSRSPADFPTSEAQDREASSVCSRRRGTGPAARLRDSGNFLGRGQRGRGTGARRFRRPPARTGKAAGAALSLGPRGGRDRKEGSVPEPRGAKRGRPADPSGAESSHPELPECRRREPKLPTGTRRINVAARPPPGRDGSLYGGNSWKKTWSGL